MKAKYFKVGLVCLGTTSLILGTFYLLNRAYANPLQIAKTDSYTFSFNSSNAPTLTGAEKEQKEVVATGLGNLLYLTYSLASNSAGAHASLAEGGYILNNKSINDMESLTVVGSGSFKLGYGIEAITHYVFFSLDESSYTLDSVDMNYFKLVATSNNAVVNSLSGVDACTAEAEYGVRQYSTSARKTDKWTRLIHDVPVTQAFTYNLSWTQTETSSGANYNPKIILLDADSLYKADDSCVTVDNSDTGFGCKGVQFGQERQVTNYKNAATSTNNVNTTNVPEVSKAGAANHFVGSDGTISTTGLVDDASGKHVGTGSGQAGLGWTVLRVGCIVNVAVTYTPDVDGLHQIEVVWNICKTVNEVDWSFTMTQKAKFSGYSNLALTAGSANCNWEILSVSSTGLR